MDTSTFVTTILPLMTNSGGGGFVWDSHALDGLSALDILIKLIPFFATILVVFVAIHMSGREPKNKK